MRIQGWPAFLAFLLPLAGGVGAFQHGINSTPERIQERETNSLKDFAAPEVMVESSGALLLGGFKALAVDFLWVRLGDLMRDHQWLEVRQIAELLTRLQPRNETVWALLVKDLMYNIPANLDRPEDKWKHVRDGIGMGLQGVARNPQSPYISFELGFSISHRMSQDVYLMERYQEAFGRNPFAEARRWIEESRRALKEHLRRDPSAREWYVTAGGLVLSEPVLVGFLREILLKEAGWALRRDGDAATARAAVERARGLVARQVERDAAAGVVDLLQQRYQAFLDDLVEAVGVEEELAALRRAGAARPALAAKALEVWRAYRRAIVNPQDPAAPRSGAQAGHRRDLVGGTLFADRWVTDLGGALGGDRWEPNDGPPFGTEVPLVDHRREFAATLAPVPEDVDDYAVVPPADGTLRIDVEWRPGALAPVVEKGLVEGYDQLAFQVKEAGRPEAGTLSLQAPVLRGELVIVRVRNAPDGPWTKEPYSVKLAFVAAQ